MKKILRRIPLIAAVCCLAVTGMAAQNDTSPAQDGPFKTQYILGINFMPEWQINNSPTNYSGNGFTSNVGLSFEARFTRHSGIETGFYYRNVKFPGRHSDFPPLASYPAYNERYFSIPILYKYYSRFVNVGAGITYDFRFDNPNESNHDKNRIGIMVKVSKDIKLYKGLFLEPEFHYNPFWASEMDGRFWVGFQIGLKYRF